MSAEQTLRQNITVLASAYVEAEHTSLTAISKAAGVDDSWFRRVINKGEGFTVRSYDKAMAYLAATWPEGLAWPVNIPRPSAEEIAVHDFASRKKPETAGAEA